MTSNRGMGSMSHAAGALLRRVDEVGWGAKRERDLGTLQTSLDDEWTPGCGCLPT
jgi:hypothetical protein